MVKNSSFYIFIFVLFIVYFFIILIFVQAFAQVFRICFCLVCDMTLSGAYASGRFDLAYWK